MIRSRRRKGLLALILNAFSRSHEQRRISWFGARDTRLVLHHTCGFENHQFESTTKPVAEQCPARSTGQDSSTSGKPKALERRAKIHRRIPEISMTLGASLLCNAVAFGQGCPWHSLAGRYQPVKKGVEGRSNSSPALLLAIKT